MRSARTKTKRVTPSSVKRTVCSKEIDGGARISFRRVRGNAPHVFLDSGLRRNDDRAVRYHAPYVFGGRLVKALLVREHGPIENVELAEAPDPVPKAGEVLIDVHAASVNFPDLLVIGGTY